MEFVNNTILIIDDDPDIREVLSDRLKSLEYRVLAASSGREGLSVLDQQGPQLVLLDIEMPGMDGLETLKEIGQREQHAPVVMMTAYATIDRAVQSMKEGAYDFISKPFELDHVAVIVEKALERENLARNIELLSGEMGERYRLTVGTSPKMNLAVETAKKAAVSKATVLLLGESGTGKEIFARAIREWSDRRDNPFIAINCVGLSRDLLESELFGHEKGAFTGAIQQKKGKMELAHGGSVFLDEIGDISPELQAKLLRFLQEREFERIGGTKTISVDVRIIAATNRDLEGAVKEGLFREDLYHRLNVIPIRLPPLRDRKEDIPALARFLLHRSSLETKKHFSEISKAALEKLQAYEWPGNVRELSNVIEQATVLGSGPQIGVEDLPPRIAAAEPGMPAETLSYHEAVDAYKRHLIESTLSRTHGNRTATARALGLQRTYLSRLIKTLQID